MPDREYQIEADEILPEGFAPGQPLHAEGDLGALADLMLKAASVLEMVGGTFSVVALRRQLQGPNGEATGLWVPDGYLAKWDSYAPGASIRRQREAAKAQAAEPESEPASDELTPEEIADHFPEPEAQPESNPADVQAVEEEIAADEEHPAAEPGVDPTPAGSSGFDMGDLLGSQPAEDVLAGVD